MSTSQDKFVLWYDNDPKRPIIQKIRSAAEVYRQRFHRQPNVCYTNPAEFPIDADRVGITVKARKNILLHHFMVGFVGGDCLVGAA